LKTLSLYWYKVFIFGGGVNERKISKKTKVKRKKEAS
jgi:hypothetical protein